MVQNHPQVAGIVGKAAAAGTKLPGFQETSDALEQSRAKRLGRTALTRLSRAWTATFVSTTAYIAGANLYGQSDEAIHDLTSNLCVEVGVMNAVAAGLMSEVPGYVKFGTVGAMVGSGLVRDLAKRRGS